MSSPKKNFVYNVIYQILILIIPLITAPYLARVVGVSGVGTYSYTYSIVYYFMLFTMLGINNYGNRMIAKVRDDKKKLSKNFWSIYLFQLLMGIVMLLIYIIYVFLSNNEYKYIATIQSIFIVSAMLDINWFFFGLEEFKRTIIKNTIVKIGNVVLILLLVKKPEDLWKYTLIMSSMTCLGQIILWTSLKQKIEFVKISFKDILKHIKPNLILFIPVIAVSLYKMMDKIMLGAMTNMNEVGYYENAEKITSIPLTLITALGTVMLPRVSNILAQGKIEELNKYFKKSIEFVMFMSFAMCFGLIGIGYHFAPFFFGETFQKTGLLIMMLALTIPFVSFANVIRTQYLIPKEKDKLYIISVSLGASVNFILNCIFIPKLGSLGACVGTIAAEFVVMLYQSLAIKNNIPIFKLILNIVPYFIKSVIMLICIYPFNYLNINPLYRLLIQIMLGCTIYGILNLKYIFSIVDIKKIFNSLRMKKIK